ncbi:unnamed protein product [Candida verbasci]|uniref:THIF-type NAD/FAD binding fold domain-containing protein n=1 Tax=Candida verbasci TaxID=1227364 RepID=A0A9W4XF22_9ASCO|nr:unnamed protein product [Candida verbasci]
MLSTLDKSINHAKLLIDAYSFDKPLIIGVSGPQGSGKSYLAEHLTNELTKQYGDKNIIQFSIDDYYLTKSAQDEINSKYKDNALLQGRGLPGTHDLPLLAQTFNKIVCNYKKPWEIIQIPSYDKSAYNGLGDRSNNSQEITKPVDIVIFEGWFLGYTSIETQLINVKYFTNPETLMIHKLYNLQQINENLQQYHKIWSHISNFIIINTNDISNVFKWRLEQEHNLIKRKKIGMNDTQVKQFINRYMPIMSSSSNSLTNDELALYDRQIRLWGMDTQLRLRSTKILLINLSSVGCEIIKNLVLGGIQSVEIQDNSIIRQEDFMGQFYLPNDDSIIGNQKIPYMIDSIKEMNSRVELTTNINELNLDDISYFKKFDLVIATELNKSQIIKLNNITRSLNVPLYCCGIHGKDGYILVDLIKHVHTKTSTFKKSDRPSIGDPYNENAHKIVLDKTHDKEGFEVFKLEDTFRSFKDIFNNPRLHKMGRTHLKRIRPSLPLILTLLDMDRPINPEDTIDKSILKEKLIAQCKHLKLPIEKYVIDSAIEKFSRQAFAEFMPTSAIIGGYVVQDIIHFLSKNDLIINNLLIYDADDVSAPISQI